LPTGIHRLPETVMQKWVTVYLTLPELRHMLMVSKKFKHVLLPEWQHRQRSQLMLTNSSASVAALQGMVVDENFRIIGPVTATESRHPDPHQYGMGQQEWAIVAAYCDDPRIVRLLKDRYGSAIHRDFRRVTADQTEMFENGIRRLSKHRSGAEWWYDDHNRSHRDGDKPAITYKDGTKFWLRHGRPHRGGGRPAVVRANGDMEWYVDGRKVQPETST
jgi:hypothetical protein